jgi:hypothetical protein
LIRTQQQYQQLTTTMTVTLKGGTAHQHQQNLIRHKHLN